MVHDRHKSVAYRSHTHTRAAQMPANTGLLHGTLRAVEECLMPFAARRGGDEGTSGGGSFALSGGICAREASSTVVTGVLAAAATPTAAVVARVHSSNASFCAAASACPDTRRPREGGEHTRQRRRLSRRWDTQGKGSGFVAKAVEHARQRQRLGRDGSGTRKAKAVPEPRTQWNTQAEAVETQGNSRVKGSVFATKAADTQGKGGAVTGSCSDGWD